MGQTSSCFNGRAAVVEHGDYVKDPEPPTAAKVADTQTQIAPLSSKQFAGQVPKHIGVFEDADAKQRSFKQLDQQQNSSTGPSTAVSCAPDAQNARTSDADSKTKLFDPHKTLDDALGHPEQPNQPHNPHQHGPPRPPCEDQRLAATDTITKYLDAAPKKELENILHLICNIFKVENALIALFGDRRIYILNTVGGFKAGDFPWRWSFCGWTMASEQHTVMVINDALQDARFADNKYVQEIGVRFYCGSPLVSSTGHRLGTWCFADTQPRIFDTSSLQILANFSELVTRELEKDIALAQQQQQREVAAANWQQQYDLLLRTADCVTSAVLLVDTSKPDWRIIHANSGWERLLKQCYRPLLLPSWHSNSSGSSTLSSGTLQNIASGSSSSSGGIVGKSRHSGYWAESTPAGGYGSSGSSSASGVFVPGAPKGPVMPINCCFADVTTPLPPSTAEAEPDTAAAAAAAAASSSGNAAASSSSNSDKFPSGPTNVIDSSSVIGMSLWSLVDHRLLQQICSSSGSSNALFRAGSTGLRNPVGPGLHNHGVHYTPGEQVIEQVKGRQSFTLRGVKLAPQFGGGTAQLTFRCAGFSMLEGAVNICLPAFCPDTSEIAAAAAALTAKNPSHQTVNPTVAPGDSLYFVTVKLHQASNGSNTSASNGSSLWTNSTSVISNQSLGGVQCSVSPSQQQQQQQPISASGGTAAAAAAGETLLTLTPCMFPQFTTPMENDSEEQQQQQQDRTSETAASSSSSSRVQGYGNLVVISSVAAPGPTTRRSGGQTDSQSNSFDMAISAESVCSKARSRGSGGSSSSSVCAGLVCSKVAGLTLGGQIAAGSYGRVYRGDYFGTKVAVKVLDGHAVLHRDEATGFCLEALLSEKLRHPNIIGTMAWAVVTGKGKLPAKKQLWGETLDPEKPSVLQNKITVSQFQQQQPAIAAAAAANKQPYAILKPDDISHGSCGGSKASVTSSVSNSANDRNNMLQNNRNKAVTVEDLEDDIDDVSAGQTWMVMEYADKGCLQDAVERGWLLQRPSCVSGGLNLVAVVATAAEIAGGMATLHEQGIVHGDLSAFNVMLSSSDASASVGSRGFVAKVADFGLSRSLAHTSKIITKTYGTITHMAPEVLEHGMVSKAADVYSFGVLLWQMVTGSRAWAGMSHVAVVKAVCSQKLQLQFTKESPDGLVLLGQACMAFDPADRPSFSDVLDILEPLNEIIAGGDISMAGGSPEEQQQQQCIGAETL